MCKQITARLIEKIREGGEFASESVKETCRERALMITLRHWCTQSLIPTWRAATSAERTVPVEKQVVKFICKLITFIAAGDSAHMRPFYAHSDNPQFSEKLVLKFASKWRPRVLESLSRYTASAALRAQRGALDRTTVHEGRMRLETQASDIASLYDITRTYRLCQYVRNSLKAILSPRIGS